MFLDNINCSDFTFLGMLGRLVSILKYSVPIILIVFITVDFTKAISSSDDKLIEKVKKDSFKRVIYAVIVFLIPTISKILFTTVLKLPNITCFTNYLK